MGPLIISILLGLASSSIQKSVKLNDVPQEPPELEAYLQNLITDSISKYYKDGNLKINLNKNRKRTEDFNKVQYLGELSSEKEPSGFKNLNKKLAKLLDGLQQRVMNEDTKDSTCSCDYANKRWPGVLKCQCGSSARVAGDDTDRQDQSGEAEILDHNDKNDDYKQDHDRLDEKSRLNQKHEDRREDRSDEDEQDEFRQLASFSKGDREDSYWSDDNYCSCKLLRSTGDKNSIKYLRCGCGSPGRLGDNKDEGYWTDDTSCGCQLLRNKDDNNDFSHYLKCGCNSPTRVGDDKEDDSEGYWSGDNRCGCQLLRNTDEDKNVHYLRCRCNSPGRVGSKADSNNDRDEGDREDGYWPDDNRCSCKLLRSTGHNNSIKYLRCGCGSPGRLGDNRESDRDEGYWTDDTSCGCQLLRNKDDDNDFSHYLKCGCNSPTRVGDDKEDDRDEGYWTDDTSCGCELLRNTDEDKNVHYLRCRCNSPGRVGSKADINNDRDEGDREDGYWPDDNRCSCKLLRSTGHNNSIKYLRCGCGSPGRLRDNREGDRDEGYWTDDTSCGCQLLRNKDDDNDFSHYLKCGCSSPTRVGDNKQDDRDDGYWTDDTSCGCELLRNIGDEKNVKNLRCRCNSPFRVGTGNSFRVSYDNAMASGRFDSTLSELSEADNGHYESKSLEGNIDEQKLNTLINHILKEDTNIDQSHLSSIKKKVLVKLRGIMPSIRNIETYKLQAKLASILNAINNPLREKNKKKSNMENPLTEKQIKRLLKLIEQQKISAKDNKQMYRRSMAEDSIGVPFTYQLQGLAQVNT